MLEVLANYVFFPMGIFALVSLLFIIILFFLKKKTTVTNLPTIMFLLNNQGKKKYKWFPRLPFNLLLLLYLLIATLLALAIMEPFYQTNASNTQDHVIHIIDNSASMQTANRFSEAITNAKSNLGLETTIIVTSPKPTVILDKGSYLQARTALSNIELTDATTPLVQTIQFLQSQNYADAALHVHSDFLDNSYTIEEIEHQLDSLQSMIVIPHSYTKGRNLVGFIEEKISKNEITLLIRNFDTKQQTTTVTIGDTTKEVKVQANDIAPITFDLPTKPVVVNLQPSDDVMSDNVYYLSAQTPVEKKLLYITQEPYAYTTSMLDVLDFITYDTYSPPGTVNSEDYDAFIIEDVDPSKLLPSNIDSALDKVYQGGVLVIKMGNKLRKMEVKEEYPFSKILTKKRGAISFTQTQVTESLTAASDEEIFPITPSEGTQTILQTTEGDVVIAYKKYGQGGILYYGISDGAFNAQFKQTYAYPILFQRIFKQTFHVPSLSEQQKKTGEQWIGSGIIINDKKESIELPTTISSNGFYTYQGSTYAANLLSLAESHSQTDENIAQIQNSSTDAKIKASLLMPIIILIIILLFLEVLFLKKRGDY